MKVYDTLNLNMYVCNFLGARLLSVLRLKNFILERIYAGYFCKKNNYWNICYLGVGVALKICFPLKIILTHKIVIYDMYYES